MRGTVNKVSIQALISKECGFHPSQRTSIYAYFFYHAGIFLKEGGYLAFICQNSWLDTDYGVDMQQYLLRNYAIVAIMDSEVERFFPSASVNTTIVVLRKQRDENARNQNIVRLVYFKEALVAVIKKYKSVDRLYDSIIRIDESGDNDCFKLNCVYQEILSKFSKWGQFLKAPKIFMDLMEKGKDKFTPLKTQAIVKYGIKTGKNDFFILEDITGSAKDVLLQAVVNNIYHLQTIEEVKQRDLCLMKNGFKELWLIEKSFLFPLLTTPKSLHTYKVASSKISHRLFTSSEKKEVLKTDYPYSFEYIKHGEKMNFNRNPSVANRKPWYDAGEKELPDMSFSYMINDFAKTYLIKAFSNDNFHNIYANGKKRSLFLYLNSTISWFLQQLIIRVNFGDGLGKLQKYEVEDMLIANINLEELKINLDETKNYKEELGSLQDLNTVNPERLKLDDAILKELGYKSKKEREDALLGLYKATYQLIHARLQKAQSLKGVKAQRNKVEFSVYTEQLKLMLLEENINVRNTFKFAKQLQKLVKEISSETKLQKRILDAYWKEKFGELFNEQEIAAGEQCKLF